MGATSLESGSVVGRRYRLERELSRQGGMGVVWIATHLVTKRRVAIKLLRAGGHDDAASRARLLREARASCAVDHPSVLPVLDVIDADGAPALVMELLEGESLRERLERQGRLAISETCSMLVPVAEALAAAHAARIVHRDIKPENIFLVSNGDRAPTVKVLDFGIAKIVSTEEGASSLTESGAMLGTPYYMAPEQAFGERDVGPPADAWALGIVIYECLTGARPTQADNLGQVIKRITQDPITPVEELVPNVPSKLAALVRRLLERDVAAREIDMGVVATTLDACIDAPGSEGDARAGARSAIEPLVSSAAPGSPRRRVPLVLAAVGIALGMGLLASSGGWPSAKLAPSASASAASAAPVATTTSPGAVSVSPTAAVSPRPASSPNLLPSASGSASAAVSATKVATAATPTSKATALAVVPSAANAKATSSDAPNAAPGAVNDDGGTTGPGHVITKNPF